MMRCSYSGDEYVDDDDLEIPDSDPGEIVIEEEEEEIVIEESQLTESTFNSTVRVKILICSFISTATFFSFLHKKSTLISAFGPVLSVWLAKLNGSKLR